MLTDKKFIFLPFLCFQISAGEQLIIPPHLTGTFRLESTPSEFNFKLEIPALSRLADAAEKTSKTVDRLPYAAGKTALVTLGGLCAVWCIYQGIKRLNEDKKDLTSAGFIVGGILGFAALCWLSTAQWFTCHQ